MTFVGAATDRRIPRREEEDVFLLVVNALLGAAAEDAAADALANDDIFDDLSSAFSFSRSLGRARKRALLSEELLSKRGRFLGQFVV